MTAVRDTAALVAEAIEQGATATLLEAGQNGAPLTYAVLDEHPVAVRAGRPDQRGHGIRVEYPDGTVHLYLTVAAETAAAILDRSLTR